MLNDYLPKDLINIVNDYQYDPFQYNNFNIVLKQLEKIIFVSCFPYTSSIKSCCHLHNDMFTNGNHDIKSHCLECYNIFIDVLLNEQIKKGYYISGIFHQILGGKGRQRLKKRLRHHPQPYSYKECFRCGN